MATFRGSPGRSAAKAVLTGILADPAATADLAKAISDAMQPEVARVARILRGVTPVSDEPARPGGGNPPPGTLRSAVDVYGVVTKDGKGFILMAKADRAVRQPTKGDSKRSASRVAAHEANEAKRRLRADAKGKTFRPRKLSAKKGGRRYGPVPYGVFVDNETGFLTDTMWDLFPDILRNINATVGHHVENLNRGSGDRPVARA